jgi:galactokinase
VALVRGDEASPFLARVLAAYEHQTGLVPKGYVCRPSAGASVEERA